MTPTEIKIELLRCGVSQAEIADSLGVQRQAVSFVVNGNRTNRPIREAVAAAINKTLLDVFPDEQFREPYGRIIKKA